MKIDSSAFPPGQVPKLSSKVHDYFEKHNSRKAPIGDVDIRRSKISDLEELRLLQNEWFPLNYSESFYNKIIEGVAICYVAETTLIPEGNDKPISVIVGAVVFQPSEDTDHLVDSWLNKLMPWQQRSVYVMTLGVIDELRSKGLAAKLLRKVIEFTAERPRIGIIALHVVDYNLRAIKFYKKNGFQLLQKIEDHYHILGKEYGGYKLGLYVNGGQRRQDWASWFKRIILRKQQRNQWPV